MNTFEVCKEHINPRTAYGETLVEIGRDNKNIVVLDADLGGSTMGKLFELAYPERHFEAGIAEANMTSMAAGLATVGKIPFVNSFAVFSSGRAFDQIRQTICIGRLNVKIVGSSAGLSDFGDGATHQSVEDLAIMRAIPNMTVICPADANEAAAATRAIAEFDGPVYLRINRHDIKNITAADAPFTIGQPSVMREGNDVVVFATGITVGLALKAAAFLDGRVSVRVVNVSTIKPLNFAKIAELSDSCRGIVCAEEHSVAGGLGSTIAEALRAAPKPMEFVGIEDTFGVSAHNYDELLQHFGITTERITEAILKF
ncbi:MAG: transketolase family protein [Defluviitaleaceae bacterium]|nr:transketolase family protein [Defluviitaleaceae bacterium]